MLLSFPWPWAWWTSRSYLFASGLRYDTYLGSRINSIEINRLLEEPSWKVFWTQKRSMSIMNSLLAKGCHEYFIFTSDAVACTYDDTYVEYAQWFANYVTMQHEQFISDPPLDEFSTQRILKRDGSICAISSLPPLTEPFFDETYQGEANESGACTFSVLRSDILVAGSLLSLWVWTTSFLLPIIVGKSQSWASFSLLV